MTGAGWDPAQYNRFAAEREQPFWDLAACLEPVVSPRLVDLGCGDGRLTVALHRRIDAGSTVGVDNAPSMLAQAERLAVPGVRFEAADIGTWTGRDVDVLWSNAALHWVGDHRRVLAAWRRTLAPGGQLAVQVPTNADHASHVVLRELAEQRLGADAPPDPVAVNVLAPEVYAELLDELGFERQHVRLQVYGHHLDSAADVVEWVKGTSLTRIRAVLAPDDYEAFVADYRDRLLRLLGDRQPYFYAFKRILLWGRLPVRDA